MVSGSTLEKTFSGADNIEPADLSHRQANFLYQQDNMFVFMDNDSFEQFEFGQETVGDVVKYLKEGQTLDVMIYNDKPVAIALPTKISLEVTAAPEGIKGNSAGAVTKQVTLETGLEVRTPLFIKTGDQIIINIESGEYVERV